jgi:membrane dipeptidase
MDTQQDAGPPTGRTGSTHGVGRRAALRLFAAAAVAPAIARARHRVFARSRTEYSTKAIDLVRAATVVDLLNQFQFPDYAEKPPRIDRWLSRPGSFTPEDAARFRESGLDVLALGHGAGSYDQAVRFFADWNGFLAAYDEWFLRVDDAADFERARGGPRVGVMLTFQDATHFRTPEACRSSVA